MPRQCSLPTEWFGSKFKSTNGYFLWICLTFPTTVVAKIKRLYHIQIVPYFYDIIIAVKPQDLTCVTRPFLAGVSLGTRPHPSRFPQSPSTKLSLEPSTIPSPEPSPTEPPTTGMGLQLSFVNGSPRVNGSSAVVEFRASGPISSIVCYLREADGEGNEIENDCEFQ